MKKKRLSPFSQLENMLQTQEQKDTLLEIIEPLKDVYRDDFCLASLAYIRFGIHRFFQNKAIQALFNYYCKVLDK